MTCSSLGTRKNYGHCVTVNKVPPDNRDPGVDLLRAMSMLYIVGYWHLVPYARAYPDYANIVTECLKDISLATFVFCSGLLLASRCFELNLRGLMTFYQRRIVRIYPLYLLSLMLFVGIGLVEWSSVFNAVLLRSMFNPPAPYTLWFISMIMVYYLATPFLVVLAEDWQHYLVVSLALLAALIVYHLRVNEIDTRVILYLPCFLFGIQLAKSKITQIWLKRHRDWMAILLVPSFLLYQNTYDNGSLSSTINSIPMLLVGATVVYLQVDRLIAIVPVRACLSIAYASYCMYLFHRPIIFFAINLYFPVGGTSRIFYLVILVLPLVFIVSYYLQKSYDWYLMSIAFPLKINKEHIAPV